MVTRRPLILQLMHVAKDDKDARIHDGSKDEFDSNRRLINIKNVSITVLYRLEVSVVCNGFDQLVEFK